MILRHVASTDCLYDPADMFHLISQHICSKVRTEPKDYMIATQEEIALEAMAVARKRSVPYRPGQQNLAYLLNARELDALNVACAKYATEFGKPATSDPNLAIFLGDSPSWGTTWSAKSNKVPTWRLNNGFMYFPYFQRWMLHSEKLSSFGFPVRAPLAQALGTPVLAIRDERRAAGLAGNCMCLPVVTIVTMIALSCFADKKSTGSLY